MTAKKKTRRRTAPQASLDERLVGVIESIPRGCVATYGQVAALAGIPGAPRQVGRFLFHLPEGTGIPWHRVVNSRGEVSRSPSRRGSDDLQQVLLEEEGVEFDARGRISLELHAWQPGRRRVTKKKRPTKKKAATKKKRATKKTRTRKGPSRKKGPSP